MGGRFFKGGGGVGTPSPIKRAFAYFSHEGKVGRGTGVKPPEFPGYGGGAPEIPRARGRRPRKKDLLIKVKQKFQVFREAKKAIQDQAAKHLKIKTAASQMV